MGDADSSKSTRLDEIIAAYLEAMETGDAASEAEIIATHPEFAEGLREFFADKQQIDRLAIASEDREKTPADAPDRTQPPTPRASAKSHSGTSQVGESIRYIGDYELLEEIARGGMGVVYKARQVKLNRIVAVKMILAGQLASDEDIKRFYTEAESAANLDHPGIVPIYEVGEHDGQHYFSMGFVEGESLAERIAKGPLSAKDAAVAVKRIAEAVEFAHNKGVIHRDLKPGNILFQNNQNSEQIAGNSPGNSNSHIELMSPDFPRITDFGLAKKIEANSSLTGSGQILGTPGYMSPEQASGGGNAVGPESDVYAIGAILYCALTGRAPFQSANPIDVLIQVAEKEPVSPRLLDSTIPQDLETICMKCLRKSPKERYQTADELAQDLNRFLCDLPIQARPRSSIEKTARFIKRHNKVLMLLFLTAVVGLVLGTAAVATWSVYSHQKTAAEIGLVSMETGGPLRTAEILSEEKDELAVPQLSIPTNRPIKLPNGRYRVFVQTPGQLSTLYKINVQPQKEQTFNMAGSSRDIWSAIKIEPGSDADNFRIEPIQKYRLLKNPDGTVNFVLREKIETVRCVDFPSGRTTWTTKYQGSFLETSFQPDINDDGKADFVLHDYVRDTIKAVSGADGTLLWESTGIEKPYRFESGHIDNDNIIDLVIVDRKNTTAISGDNGTKLWNNRYPGDSVDETRELWGIQHDADQAGDELVFYEEFFGVVFARSLRSGKKIWRSEQKHDMNNPVMYTALDDLNGDAVPEVVHTTDEFSPMLHVVDAKSGQLLWEQKFHHDDAFVRHGTTTGTDANGDGYRDIYFAFVDNKVAKGSAQICTYAVSGKDGEIIWSNKFSAPAAYDWNGVTLELCLNNGSWPSLIVSQGYWRGGSSPDENGKDNIAYLFSTADGLIQSTIPEAIHVQSADLNGDGIDDVHWYDSAPKTLSFASGDIGLPNDLLATGTSESTYHQFAGLPWVSYGGSLLSGCVWMIVVITFVFGFGGKSIFHHRRAIIFVCFAFMFFGGIAVFSVNGGIMNAALGAAIWPLIFFSNERINLNPSLAKQIIRKMFLLLGSIAAAFVIGILWLWIDSIGADQLALYEWNGWYDIFPYGLLFATSFFLMVDILFGGAANLKDINVLPKETDVADEKPRQIPPKEWFDALGK